MLARVAAAVVALEQRLENRSLLSVHSLPMLTRKKPEDQRKFQVGDRVSLTLHTGQLVEGTVRAVVWRTDGVHLQVDYGKDETALVELWRVHAR